MFIAAITLVGCVAPRSNIHSGRVTPKGDIKLGLDIPINIPLSTIEVASDVTAEEINAFKKDQERSQESVYRYSRLVLAQSVDPIGVSNQLYARYGLIDNLDIGLAYGSAGLIADTAYQLLHSKNNTFDASIGLQYNQQDYELPSPVNKVQDILGYTFKRRDVLLRATLSLPFGEDERFGAFGFGAVLSYTNLSYGFEPNELSYVVGDQSTLLPGVPEGSSSFLAYGGFANIKLGYKYIYFVASLSIYYQNYGEYKLLDNKSVTLDGLSFVPSFGVQGAF